MAKVFDFTDYKKFILAWIEEQPKGGRGQFSKLAEVTGIHKANVSHIFKGEHQLSPEQAHKIAVYLGLGMTESRYFLLLVNFDRAGTAKLREFYKTQIEEEKQSHKKLEKRVTRSRELTSEERAIFYSNWAYSAVRILSSIAGFQTREAIFKRLNLTRKFGNGIIKFLVNTGFCHEVDGRVEMGPQMTHLEEDSPLVARHHGNWRVKAMEKHPMLNPGEELAYSAAMSLSSSDVIRIRELLAHLVQKTDEIVGPSACERMFCMNLDWFEVKGEFEGG